MKERQRHIDAFEQYFSFFQRGFSRNEAIEEVAKKTGVTSRTIWDWKKKFNWDEREAIRSAEIQKGVKEKTNATIVDHKVQYLSFYHKLLNDLKNSWDIKINNVNDLVKVTDACLNLQGQTTENISLELQILDELKSEIKGKTATDLMRKISDDRTRKREAKKSDDS